MSWLAWYLAGAFSLGLVLWNRPVRNKTMETAIKNYLMVGKSTGEN